MTTIIRVKSIDIIKDQVEPLNTYYKVKDETEYKKKFVRCDLLAIIPFIFPTAHLITRRNMNITPDWIEFVDKYDDDIDLDLLKAFSTKVSVHVKDKDKNGNRVITLYNKIKGYTLIQSKLYSKLYAENMLYRDYLNNHEFNNPSLEESIKTVKSFNLTQLNDCIYANMLLEIIDEENSIILFPTNKYTKNLPTRKQAVFRAHPDSKEEIERFINSDNDELNSIRTNMKIKVANMIHYLTSLEELKRILKLEVK